MSEWRALSSRGVHVMSLSVPQPTAEQRPVAASLVPAGFFCWKVIFSRGSQSLFFFSIWKYLIKQKKASSLSSVPLQPLFPFDVFFFFRFFFFQLFLICPCLQHTGWSSLCSHPAFRGSAVVSGCFEGTRHGVETVYCTFCNQSCFILYIQIDIYAHDVIWFYKGGGRGSWCVRRQKDSNGTQKWIETTWVLFLGVFRLLPLQLLVVDIIRLMYEPH